MYLFVCLFPSETVPVSTTVGISIAVVLLFVTVGFTVGVVTGLFSRRHHSKGDTLAVAADNIQLSGVTPVAMDSTPTTAPESVCMRASSHIFSLQIILHMDANSSLL